MSFERLPENRVFIYGKMEPELANRKLWEALTKLSAEKLEQVKASGGTLWLLRESRELGMLTVHSIKYNAEKSKWVFNGPVRLALLNEEWVNLHYEDEINQFKDQITFLNREMGDQHVRQLEDLVKTHLNLTIENRVNPAVSEQTNVSIYSCYNVNNLKPILSLPPDIRDALTCSLTNKIFKNPVVAKCNIPDKNIKRGVSYERAALENLGLIIREDFYENLQLKAIINYIGSDIERLSKLKKIDEFEIMDIMTGKLIKNARITPAGFSYSQESIENWIETKGGTATDPKNPSIIITRDSLISNINLDEFISAWPKFYKDRVAELSTSEINRSESKPSP